MCSHVAALLFKVKAACRLGYNNPSCTSQPCQWNQAFSCKVYYLASLFLNYIYRCNHCKVDPAPVSQIQFVKPSQKRGISEDVSDLPVRKTQTIPLIDPEDLYRSFYSLVPNASLFTIVPPPDESSVPSTSVINPLTSVCGSE